MTIRKKNVISASEARNSALLAKTNEEIGRHLLRTEFKESSLQCAAERYPIPTKLNMLLSLSDQSYFEEQQLVEVASALSGKYLDWAIADPDATLFLLARSLALRFDFERAGRAFRQWCEKVVPRFPVLRARQKLMLARDLVNAKRQMAHSEQLIKWFPIATELRNANPDMSDSQLAKIVASRTGSKLNTVRSNLKRLRSDKKGYRARDGQALSHALEQDLAGIANNDRRSRK